MTGVLAALGAALAWTSASALWRSLSHVGSALQLNCLKNSLATMLFLPILLTLPWSEFPIESLLLLASGVIGIALGDSFYLAALRRLGTRRTLTVEAIGPVLASIGTVSLARESLTLQAWIGAALVSTAVLLIAWPNGSDDYSSFNRDGLLCSLMAVICGLSGAFLARQVLVGGDLSALQSAAIRLLGGALALLPFSARAWRKLPNQSAAINGRLMIATVLGTNLGIGLQQVVFQQLPVGPGVTLMSTAPVMALVAARFEGDPLQPRGIGAALLAVAGVAFTSL
ncbi:DMT family transporter [Synechococcus sp. CC9616]|uniref:DMT family transporter n=1 Tax=Synechococcus sp. CC9616 TaxID=110663 RepID=UPI00048C9A43|nr:DMT family transporter [Synechococcus sp. CC9616]